MTGIAGAVLAGRAPIARAALPNAGMRVAVIGAGIIGAPIAYHLVRDGAQVTVLEKEAPAAGATGNSFAWLNAGGKRPRACHTLDLLRILGWHRLQTEIGEGALPMPWGGCGQWRNGAEDAARTSKSVARQQE